MLSFDYEQRLWDAGYRHIAGVDEVGRDAWAGPIVAAAVILPADFDTSALRDSKTMTKRARELGAVVIKARCVAWSVAEVSSAEIDKIGLTRANKKVLRLAVLALATSPHYVLVDGNMGINVDMATVNLVDGDATIPSIAAASVVAKVYRDQLMADYAPAYPGYGFEQHVGYGTARHQAALQQHGVCPLHRRSFRPILKFL